MLGDYQSMPPLPISPEDIKLARSVQFVLAAYRDKLAVMAEQALDYPLRQQCARRLSEQRARLRESHWLFPIAESGGPLEAFDPPPECRERSQLFLSSLEVIMPAECLHDDWCRLEHELLRLLKSYLTERPHPMIQLWLADEAAWLQHEVES